MESTVSPITRLERVLAYMVAGAIVASLLCFFAVLIGSMTGQGAAQATGMGPWTFIIMFPYFGLPAGMLLLIGLVIVGSIRRGRETRPRP